MELGLNWEFRHCVAIHDWKEDGSRPTGDQKFHVGIQSVSFGETRTVSCARVASMFYYILNTKLRNRKR